MVTMKEQLILSETELEKIKDSTLFYPCSGNDLLVPIEIFSPYVIDFWFVDTGYFTPGNQDTRFSGLDKPADEQRPVLERDNRYELISKDIIGPPSWSSEDRDIIPCILTEAYRHIQTGRKIRIHRRRGYGYSAFRTEIETLGVFFYRGDSQGEGGSGNQWLREEHIYEICNKLINDGLIVSDGSDGSPYPSYKGKGGIYKRTWKKLRSSASKDPEELIRLAGSFTDHRQRLFRCVGYAGEKYGPTMIWQVAR